MIHLGQRSVFIQLKFFLLFGKQILEFISRHLILHQIEKETHTRTDNKRKKPKEHSRREQKKRQREREENRRGEEKKREEESGGTIEEKRSWVIPEIEAVYSTIAFPESPRKCK